MCTGASGTRRGREQGVTHYAVGTLGDLLLLGHRRASLHLAANLEALVAQHVNSGWVSSCGSRPSSSLGNTVIPPSNESSRATFPAMDVFQGPVKVGQSACRAT